MLTIRKTVPILLVSLGLLLLIDSVWRVSPWYYGSLVLAAIIIFAAGSIFIRLGFYLESHNRGNRHKKIVSLSFDDGPDPSVTPEVLKILRQHQVQAVFFVIGSKANNNSGLIKQMDREGHLIGNHSYSHHFFFDLMGTSKMTEELKKTEVIVYNAIQKKMKLFRPPYGVTNPSLARSLRRLKLDSIGWSLKSRDTVTEDAKLLLLRLKNRVRPGDLILFHDDRRIILRVLGEFIEYLKEQQFTIVRPDLLLNLQAYENSH